MMGEVIKYEFRKISLTVYGIWYSIWTRVEADGSPRIRLKMISDGQWIAGGK